MSGSSKGRPILRLAVSAADSADDKRLENALAEIAIQSANISISTQPQGRLYGLDGRTESELDSICDRLRDQYHLTINVGSPEAVLIETIRKRAEGEGKYIRQTGGSGNYGHCKLRIEPNEPGKGYEFINKIRAEAVPIQYIDPIDQGIQAAMESGILAGFPMVDVKVALFDGSYHELDSNEVAFKFAGSIAFKEAAKQASPVLLEPMMALEIDVPEDLIAEVQSEIRTHRGRVECIQTTNGFSKIEAIVPLSELLTSASTGFAECPTKFVGYEAVRGGGPSDENTSGVTANKPNRPRPGSRSTTARFNPEEE